MNCVCMCAVGVLVCGVRVCMFCECVLFEKTSTYRIRIISF